MLRNSALLQATASLSLPILCTSLSSAFPWSQGLHLQVKMLIQKAVCVEWGVSSSLYSLLSDDPYVNFRGGTIWSWHRERGGSLLEKDGPDWAQ